MRNLLGISASFDLEQLDAPYSLFIVENDMPEFNSGE